VDVVASAPARSGDDVVALRFCTVHDVADVAVKRSSAPLDETLTKDLVDVARVTGSP
jgi:hypothetical protein